MRGLVLVVLLGACSGGAVSEAPVPSPYPEDPGYVFVDRTLPRLRFQGQWFRRVGDGEPELVELGKLTGERVVIEGKMMLGDTEPYPRSFLIGPPYPGCVHPGEEGLDRAVIDVVLPEGGRVQVTDRLLWAEGVLAPSTEPGVVARLVDARVQRLSAMKVEQLPRQ
ncbi:MAG: hypothetical protein AMXMBFR64_23940 [Myxococcales bacterium]